MDKSVCIVLLANSNVELIKRTLSSIENFHYINELYILNNSASIKNIQEIINEEKFVYIPKKEIK